ncbi:hypothetical protein BCR37DRAFT_384740 [Protomyces lactucae-debilis]|uniref:EamA domain-containing protein n=1 Tax=Protomyces lactucae-debilis TaxID=2754530 RepID=A0A1Y2EQX7_PROLT|nr:uncharacterized protein BCR37DRAFT_384740 [Protomyces lactucae-debilis]ORY73694.1 hypothetical protein BCR37DRAFT_384740 [Protomyces lactucae-debilis]
MSKVGRGNGERRVDVGAKVTESIEADDAQPLDHHRSFSSPNSIRPAAIGTCSRLLVSLRFMSEQNLNRMSSRAALLSSADQEDEAHETAANARRRTQSQATFRSFATVKSSADASRSAYLYAIGIALPISLVCFTIQTELAQYIQAKLHYEKPYFMLYVTHSSWWLNGVGMWVWLRLRQPGTSTTVVTKRMLSDISDTARAVMAKSGAGDRSMILHMSAVITICGLCLTVAATTWYLAVNMTTASDLSAIYNSSAFFAYAFSIPLLKERVRLDKLIAVGLSVLGVLVIAYGDSDPSDDTANSSRRTLGNLIISIGAVLYGLYEVLYKKLGCPPDQYEPGKSIIFANAMATALGLFTLTIMWIPIPLLHIIGWERFEAPPAAAVWALIASVAANFIYSSCLLAMISLTSPVLASVASLLSIFMVAIVDTFITGKPLSLAAIAGGVLIGVAFGILCWASYSSLEDEESTDLEDGDVFEVSDDESDQERGSRV